MNDMFVDIMHFMPLHIHSNSETLYFWLHVTCHGKC